jgi:hypothetical protein
MREVDWQAMGKGRPLPYMNCIAAWDEWTRASIPLR